MTKPIDVVVFEDKYAPFGEEFYNQLPRSIEILGEETDVRWHTDWNAAGDALKDQLGFSATLLRSIEDFRAALHWCLHFSGRAICFVDYKLEGIRVEKGDVERVGELVLRLTKTETSEEAVNYLFERDSQGLLLAAALAMNDSADLDIVLATGVAAGTREHERILRECGRAKAVKATYSLTRSGIERAVEDLTEAVERYRRQRVLFDPGFWPDYATEWFAIDRQFLPAPHKHRHFCLVKEKQLAPSLFTYIKSLGASDEIAEMWLQIEECYDSLKHFVGALAALQSNEGEREPWLSSLVFPLLAFDADQWAAHFDWTIYGLTVPICQEKGDKDNKTTGVRHDCRRFILEARKLFGLLHEGQRTGEPNHSVRVSIEKREDGIHLFVDFSFNCSFGEPDSGGGKSSLLEKTQAIGSSPGPGDTAAAFLGLRELIVKGDIGVLLDLTLYPVRVSDSSWTRLDFRVGR